MPNRFHSGTALANDTTVPWVLSYGSFTFPNWSVQLSSEPVYDDARRCLKYVRYMVTAETPVARYHDQTNSPPDIRDAGGNLTTAQTDQDSWMDSLQTTLSTPRLRLVVQRGGIGSIDTATAADTDLIWGPTPLGLEVRAAGGGVTAMVSWHCEFHLAACTPNLSGLLSYNWSASYSEDDEGLTTRTITGSLEVPMPGAGGRFAGSLRELVNFELPLAFRRRSNWNESNDGRRLDFTITDTEESSPFAYPPGVTDVKAEMSVNTMQAGTMQWYWSVNATIRTVPRVSKRVAWLAWRRIVGPRIARALRNAEPVAGGGQNQQGARSFIPVSFGLSESLFGTTTRVHVTYMLISKLSTFFKAAGFFEPVSGPNGQGTSDWQDWRSSLADLSFAARGVAQLRTPDNFPGDCSVTVCASSAPPGVAAFGATPETPTPNYQDVPPIPPTRTQGQSSGEQWLTQTEIPPPESSFLDYQIGIRQTMDHRVTFSPVMQEPEQSSGLTYGTDTSASAPPAPSFASNGFDPAATQIPMPPPGGTPHVISRGGANSSLSLELYGSAIRAGYPTPPPRLVEVGGVPAVETESTVDHLALRVIAGVVIYRTDFALRYVFDRPPSGELVAPRNPVSGGGGVLSDMSSGTDPGRGQPRPE